MCNENLNTIGENIFYISIMDVDNKRHTVANIRQSDEIKRFNPLGDKDMLITDISLKYIANFKYYNKWFLGEITENVSINESIHFESPLKLELAVEGILNQSGLQHLLNK